MTTFRELEIGARFEFVEGLAGLWVKVSPRTYRTADPDKWYGVRRRSAKSTDKVRLAP